MNKFDRRIFLTGTAGAAGLMMLGGLSAPARAAGPLTVGVLIPGSKSDKGWMESGYDGLKEAEKKLGAKITVKYIENVKFGDMEQVLVTLAGKNELVIGVGGQTQASVFKVAPRFPKVKFAIIGGNADPKKPDNVSGYDVRQAEIAFAAGAAAAMLSKTGGVSYVGGLEIPAIKNAGIEFGNGARYINPKIKYFEKLHRRLRRRRQGQGGDPGRHRPGRRHPLPHPQSRPARHGAGGAREGHAHHRRLYRSLRHRSALCRLLDHRRRLPGRLRHGAGRSPARGSRSSSRSAWPWVRNPPT